MDKVKDTAESNAVPPTSQKPPEPRRPSSEPLADDPRQRLYDLGIRGNFVDSPENENAGVFEETDDDDGIFSLVIPGIDRTDVVDLLEREMPHITGSWSIKRGGEEVFSFRSLKLMMTHDSENTMILTADLVVHFLDALLKRTSPLLNQFPQLTANGNLYLVRHDDGQVERMPGVPCQWQLLRRADEDRREEAAAAARGGGVQAPGDAD